MPAARPAPRPSSNPIARAVIRWLESAAPLAPRADGHATRAAAGAALASCGAAAAEPATRHRRIDGWIAK